MSAALPGEWVNGERCLRVTYRDPPRIYSLPMSIIMDLSLAVAGAECGTTDRLGGGLEVAFGD